MNKEGERRMKNHTKPRKIVEQLLIEYSDIDRKINSLNKEAEKIEARIEELKAAAWSGMPHGSETSDPVFRIVQPIVDIHNDHVKIIKKRIEDLYEQKEYTWELVNSKLEPIQAQIVINRYFNELEWEKICRKVNYSRRQAARILVEAVDILKVSHNVT
jgi:hypothetical protein